MKIEELESEEVLQKIDSIFTKVLTQINKKEMPYLEVPLRRRENIVYNQHGNLFLGNSTEKFSFDGPYEDYLQILSIARFVKNLLTENVHATKREIYYKDVKLFAMDQGWADRAIDNLAVLLETRRKCLNIVASAKGVCIGSLKIRDSGDEIDLERLGSRGWAITPLLEKVDILESDAEFILVSEKEAAFIQFTEEKLWKKIPCIILTGKGMPDIATREFLKTLVKELKIPAYGIFDSDPYGIDIMLTFALGSVSTAHETPWLAVNNFYWLGVYPNEVENLPKESILPPSDSDIKKAKRMLLRPYIQKRNDLKLQLELFLNKKYKAEIQSLSRKRFGYIIEYIIEKVQTGNLIKI